MKEFHFERHLTKTNLNNLAALYHVKNSAYIEKYIMDFEILFHILRILPRCVVKGGMAVTFYVDGSLRRLSEDIDIATPDTKEETENAINNLKSHLEPLVDIQLHIPKNPTKRLPMLTYWCKYRSSTSSDAQIKLDILYGQKEITRHKIVGGKTKFVNFTIDFPMSVCGSATLIADKMTTLAFQTIGLEESRRHDAPKQIYDIVSLLKSFDGDIQIGEVVDQFVNVSMAESQYCKEEYSLDEIMADLETFSNSMIDGKLKLNLRDEGHLGTFKTQLLAANYNRTDYVTDILLITLFIRLIRDVINKIQKPETVRIKMMDVLTRLKDVSNPDQAKKWRRAVIQKYVGQDKKRVIQFPSRQLYLYDYIQEIER